MPHLKISIGSYKARENGDRLHRIPKVLVYSGILFHTFHFALICPIMKIRNLSIGPSEVEFVLNVIGLRSSCGASLAQY